MSDSSEKWLPVPGYPLEASSLGRARSLTRRVLIPANATKEAHYRTYYGKVLSQFTLSNGYIRVSKYPDVHRLVCLAFHGLPPEGKPLATHKNGIRSENVPDNLRWGSNTDNMQDKNLHGTMPRGQKISAAKLSDLQATEMKRRLANGETGVLLAVEFGVSSSTVSLINRNRIWKWIALNA